MSKRKRDLSHLRTPVVSARRTAAIKAGWARRRARLKQEAKLLPVVVEGAQPVIAYGDGPKQVRRRVSPDDKLDTVKALLATVMTIMKGGT